MTAVIDPAQKARRRPFEGWGATIAAGLSAFAGALIRRTGKLYGEARERGGAALTEFQARPEHSRWRAYAIGGYAVIAAGTLVGQLYKENRLGAVVRVERVEMPALTQVFVRNGSDEDWKNVKVTLNDVYVYEKNEVLAGGFVLLPVERFALFDAQGHRTFAPKNIVPRRIAVETREHRYETELKP